MDVKTRLETALAGFAEGVLWPFACPLETEPDLWMVYFPEKEQPVDYGDGNSLTWELFWQVQWFTKGTQDNADDTFLQYFGDRKKIERRQSMGFWERTKSRSRDPTKTAEERVETSI